MINNRKQEVKFNGESVTKCLSMKFDFNERAVLSPQYVFDHQDGDVFGCVADIGWITGHSYVVYGPLCNGATTVLFESTPVYPDPGEASVHFTAACFSVFLTSFFHK